MESRNCSKGAPEFYTSMMHNFHFASFPVYVITFNALFRESSPMFQTYKYYLMVHIFINIISEVYVTFFMLPMTYLPLPILRNTGWLADWGFSGMFQFYGLAQSVMTTVGSILEMFYYRFNITSIHVVKSKFRFWLKVQVFVYRIFIVAHPILVALTINKSIELEGLETMRIWMENPSLPLEITCYSVIVAIYNDYLVWVLIAMYGIQVVIQLVVSSGTLASIRKFMSMASGISKNTAKMQRMLIFSLFIQGGIHGFMIMLPTIFLIYALLLNSALNDLAHAFLMCVAYHGFASTCVMIVFTKPLRDRVLPCFRKNSAKIEQRIMSNVMSTTSHDNRSIHMQ